MDPGYIKAFVSSIQNVFTTMFQLQVSIGAPYVKGDPSPKYDVSGIIGMSGDVSGSVVLSFPTDTAGGIVALFTGTKLEVGTADFADAIGELVNMVSGGAKAQFKDKRVSISCPSVVIGVGHILARQSDVPCIVIPCTTDCGEFSLEIAIRENAAAVKVGASAAVARTA